MSDNPVLIQPVSFFFHDDGNVYHVTCNHIENSVSCDSGDFDYEFFFPIPNAVYHVTCKLLSGPLIVNMLNKEVYGMDFDVNNLKRKYLTLTPPQKFNLELNLKQILSLNFS